MDLFQQGVIFDPPHTVYLNWCNIVDPAMKKIHSPSHRTSNIEIKDRNVRISENIFPNIQGLNKMARNNRNSKFEEIFTVQSSKS